MLPIISSWWLVLPQDVVVCEAQTHTCTLLLGIDLPQSHMEPLLQWSFLLVRITFGRDGVIWHHKELWHKQPEQVVKGWQYSESMRHGKLMSLMHWQDVPISAISEGPKKDLTLGNWCGAWLLSSRRRSESMDQRVSSSFIAKGKALLRTTYFAQRLQVGRKSNFQWIKTLITWSMCPHRTSGLENGPSLTAPWQLLHTECGASSLLVQWLMSQG